MSAGDLRDVLSSLRGFCKKREDGTSKTYIVEKLKKVRIPPPHLTYPPR